MDGISENPVARLHGFRLFAGVIGCLWQTAVEALILVAESNGGPTMLARIGVMRALNRQVERVFNPNRKDHHWGKRKLARDR